MEEIEIMGYFEVLKREIGIFKNSKTLWGVTTIVPVIFCMLICIIFSNGVPKELPIGVFNNDNSQLSRTIVRDINTLQSTKVKYQVTSMQEGNELLQEGKIYGLVVIPKDFQKDIYRLQRPQLVFYYNNQRILIGGIVNKDISLLLKSLTVGLDAKIRAKKGLPFDEAVKQANLIKVTDHVRSNPYLNYQFYISLTAFGHLLQICMVFTSVYAIGREFRYGTAKKWLELANNSIIIAFCGKMTLYFLLFLSVFLFVYFVYFIIQQAPFEGNIIAGMVATIAYIISALSIGVLFIGINGNVRFGLSAASFYSAMGFAFAGLTFPIIAMPMLAKMYSSLLPLVYWVQIMLDQTLRVFPVIYDFKPFVYIILLSVLGLCFLPRVKKFANDESCWYRL